jgi:hypothetical protein
MHYLIIHGPRGISTASHSPARGGQCKPFFNYITTRPTVTNSIRERCNVSCMALQKECPNVLCYAELYTGRGEEAGMRDKETPGKKSCKVPFDVQCN